MTALNELIERLYNENIGQADQPKPSAEVPSSSDNSEEEAETRRMLHVLNEMGALLNEDDQPKIEDSPSEEALLRVLNHWEAMTHSVQGIKEHMQSLELDIAKMQPWGDFDVMKVEQLANHGCYVRFWKMNGELLSQKVEEPWFIECNVLVVSQDIETSYFVTVTDDEDTPSVPAEAEEVIICPCPVSTLIMLQTRDKDSLKKMETLLGDYALVHYGEVYSALRKKLPKNAELPQLVHQRESLRDKLRNFFKRESKG
ncbi:MAG: hypothetical protein J5543_03040 [Bacteroidales bacterium]|nr:hypothetical protein [Bacteroidales bacterium]